MQRANTRQLLIAASMALSGCAAGLPPIPPGTYVKGQVPAGALPEVARIVANALPIDLAGFWNDPKERAEFEKRRAESIASRVAATPSPVDANGIGRCISSHPLCLPLLPVVIPMAIVGSAAAARIRAGIDESSIPISEEDSARHVAFFTERLTGASLGEHTLRLIRSDPARSGNDAEFPRLVVSMTSATVRWARGEDPRISIVAQVQAYPAAGIEWAPTEHEVNLEFWPKHDYTSVTPRILDVLAQSIVSTYLPEHAFSVEKRHWERVGGTSVAQVQTYLDRYPEGTFADRAREQIAKLAVEEAAARKLAAEKAAVDKDSDIAALRKLFMARAHVHPELEGSWAGVTSSAACGTGSYKIVINNGYVEGTVDWQGNAGMRLQVSGYVNAEGVVTIATFSAGRFGRPAESSLVLQTGSLVGHRIEACGHYTQTFISLSRD